MTSTDVTAAAQEFEADWWGNCTTTFGEEAKQLSYAHRMGLQRQEIDGRWPVYDLEGKSVLDIGGGPVSILLKCINGGTRVVVDPCPYPVWVKTRYAFSNIALLQEPAEDFATTEMFDECWIYNVLQHVVDPEQVIRVARRQAKVIRLFEWIETETNVGHPHALRADKLNVWLGGVGEIGLVEENSAYGLGYWGVFDV